MQPAFFICMLFIGYASLSTAFKSSLASIGLKNARCRQSLQPLRFDLNDHAPNLATMDVDAVHSQISSILSNSWFLAEEAVASYSKVDKTGFIGFIATYIEMAIDLFRSTFQSLGVQNAYGFSIILFTLLIKALTLPLTYQQLESTTRIQKITPLQQKIQAKYAKDEETKNKLIAQLFQAAQVNPLAGCFPALVQIPVFISLYRALTNLVAQNKLDEPFLWIPDLEGPVYQTPPSKAMDWIYSIFSGNPALGWHDTAAFLSIPLILYISQTISQKVLTPPRDPNRVMTEQEQVSQGIFNNLPFIVAFFSINVPAGLGLYWVANNILTTLITITIKSQIKDEPFPPEVDQIMAFVESGPKQPISSGPSPSNQELRGAGTRLDARPKAEGFGARSTVVDTTIVETEGSDAGDNEDGEEGNEIEGADSEASASSDESSEVKSARKKAKAGKKGKRRG